MAFDFPNSPAVGDVYRPTTGVSWQWDGTAWRSFQVNAEMAVVKTFLPGTSSPGSMTYNKPANLRYLEFEGSAGGGSGSGAAATAASTFAYGAGGSAGAWGRRLFAAVELPASVAVVAGNSGAASNGAGTVGGDTTFGSIITLPGGPGGAQGANTTGANIFGNPNAASAAPTGVTVGAPGGRGGQSMANMTNPVGNTLMGGGGISPYGSAYPDYISQNVVGTAGTGYGAGGSSAANGASQSARASGAGAPGFVLLTEYLAVAAADVLTPARQVFYPTSSGVNIPVPPTAKHAKISGRIFAATTPMYVHMRLSIDGTTFYAGASDYIYGGTALYTGSTVSPTKLAPAATNGLVFGSQTDRVDVPIFLDVDLVVNKTASQLFTYRARSWYYNTAATVVFAEALYAGYPNVPALSSALQLAAFQIVPGTATFGAGSMVIVDWSY